MSTITSQTQAYPARYTRKSIPATIGMSPKSRTDRCMKVGMLDLPRIESARRVYDGGGLCPTIMTGAEKDINILLYENRRQDRESQG